MNITRRALLFSAVGAVSLTTLSAAAFAQTTSSSASTVPVNPAACSAALDAQQNAWGPAHDKLLTTQKAAMQIRVTALKAALALTDTAQRQTAIQNAEKLFRQSMSDAMKQNATDMKVTTDAVRTACKGLLGGRDGRMGNGMGMMGPKGAKGTDDANETNERGGKGMGMHRGWGKQSSASSTSATQRTNQ